MVWSSVFPATLHFLLSLLISSAISNWSVRWYCSPIYFNFGQRSMIHGTLISFCFLRLHISNALYVSSALLCWTYSIPFTFRLACYICYIPSTFIGYLDGWLPVVFDTTLYQAFFLVLFQYSPIYIPVFIPLYLYGVLFAHVLYGVLTPLPLRTFVTFFLSLIQLSAPLATFFFF